MWNERKMMEESRLIESCIRQRTKDGKYIVSLDYGSRLKKNPKTGLMERKQVKTRRVVDTLKEARALKGENAKEKRLRKTTGRTSPLLFPMALDEYMELNEGKWSLTYRQQKIVQTKRLKFYFADRDVREIDTLDIERFFEWCRHPHEEFPNALINNTLYKYKSTLTDLWKFMKKHRSKYFVTENIVLDADVGRPVRFEATTLNIEQLNRLLDLMLRNEQDFAFYALVGCAGLTGMRRGEICGLRWGDIDWEKKRISVLRSRVRAGSVTVEKLPKGEKTRISALSDPLAKLLKIVKENQEEILDRAVRDDEYVFMQKTNLLNNYLPNPGKLDRRFHEMLTRINRVMEEAGQEPLPHIRMHDLRHTFITLALNAKVDHLMVSSNVGHTIKGNTTTAVYWHDQGERQEIIDFVDRIITVPIKAYWRAWEYGGTNAIPES